MAEQRSTSRGAPATHPESAPRELVSDVAVLYVDPRGPYPELVEHWYDAERDARKYEGPLPVVAHPPCGPWGRLRHLSRKDDPALALRAVCQVRSFGGVLEHPCGSKLWAAAGLPTPGALPDAWGGRSIEVCQCDWGHVARKRTWLYIVGRAVLPPIPPPREPTHWIGAFRFHEGHATKNYRNRGKPCPPGIKVCSAQQRRRTPRAFAEWLLEVARASRSSEVPRVA